MPSFHAQTGSKGNAPSAARKRALRQHFRAQRRALSPAQQRRHAQRTCKHLQDSGLFWRTGAFAVYAAAPGELDPAPLLHHGWQQQRTMALPTVLWSATAPTGRLQFRALRPQQRLVRGAFGLSEPPTSAPVVAARTLGVIFLPLVAFDDQGMRLGQGGGFYDRLLSALTRSAHETGPLRIGLAHGCQRSAEPLPADPWDIRLDAVATERGIAPFTRRGRLLLRHGARASVQ